MRTIKLLLYIAAVFVFTAPVMAQQEEYHKKMAKVWLELARRDYSTGDVSLNVDLVREELQKAKLALQDIGTSEKEVSDMLHKGYVSEAKLWIRLARERKTQGDITYAIDHILEFTKKAGVTLANVGTSETEMKSLLMTGYKSEAAVWLKLARERKPHERDVKSEVDHCREFLSKGKLKPENICTTESELEKLSQVK